MQKVEKKIAKDQGLRGFRRMKTEVFANDEKQRSAVLTKLLHTKMTNDDKDEAKQLLQQQLEEKNRVDEDDGDADSWGSMGQLPEDMQAQNMNLRQILSKNLLMERIYKTFKLKDDDDDGAAAQ